MDVLQMHEATMRLLGLTAPLPSFAALSLPTKFPAPFDIPGLVQSLEAARQPGLSAAPIRGLHYAVQPELHVHVHLGRGGDAGGVGWAREEG